MQDWKLTDLGAGYSYGLRYQIETIEQHPTDTTRAASVLVASCPSKEYAEQIIREHEAAQQQAADDSTPKCTVTWFTDGGRTEKQCPEPAEAICADCGEGRCDEHQGDSDHTLIFYRTTDGLVICDECITDELREGAEEVSTWHR